MTYNITTDFIQSHSLMDCLREFDGSHSEGDPAKIKELSGIFYLLAQKMLYGGYFAVYKDGVVARRIYINCVEFYYHEEEADGFKDWIVYHRNPVNGKNKKAAFPLGSLHSHVSGVISPSKIRRLRPMMFAIEPPPSSANSWLQMVTTTNAVLSIFILHTYTSTFTRNLPSKTFISSGSL